MKGPKMEDPINSYLYPVPTKKKKPERQNKDRDCSFESLVASQACEVTVDRAKGLQQRDQHHQRSPAHLLPTVYCSHLLGKGSRPPLHACDLG